MTKFVFALVFGLLCAQAFAGTPGCGIPVKPATVEAARKSIAQGYLAWIDATKQKDSTAQAALYDEDAIILPPGGDAVRGRAAILEFYKKFNAEPVELVEERFDPFSLDVCGDVAMDVSEFSGKEKVPDKGILSYRGKNLVVWKHESDGSWKLYRDIWNASPKPPETK